MLALATLVAASIAFASWYRAHYSMDVARSFEAGDPQAMSRVLIATQGSEFKDAVVAGIVDQLRARAAYVRVADLSVLPGVIEDEWDAIVLIHTWEMRKPPAAAKAFVDRVRDTRKLVVLTTSGAGDFKMPGVDALSSASVIAEAPLRVADVMARIDAILGAMDGA